MDKKIPAVAIAVCSAAPPNAHRRRTSKKGKAKSCAGDTTSFAIRPENTKSSESSKRKRKLPKVHDLDHESMTSFTPRFITI
jgi:hypothetical protein